MIYLVMRMDCYRRVEAIVSEKPQRRAAELVRDNYNRKNHGLPYVYYIVKGQTPTVPLGKQVTLPEIQVSATTIDLD